MKRIMALALAWLLASAACCAMAAQKTYELDEGVNGYFVCEDYDGELTPMAQRIFGDFMCGGDEVLCGTLFEEHYRNSPGRTGRGGALMAVRRDGRILLMSGNTDGDGWSAAIETDGFLPPDAQFSMTTMGGMRTYAHLTIAYRDTAYEIRTTAAGGAYLYEYSWTDENGKMMQMSCYHGEFTLNEKLDEKRLPIAEGKPIPARLCAWRVDDLPKTAQALQAFDQAHPLTLAENEGFTAGVNLRERPTGEAPTWGKYSAKVTVLGEKPGKTAPWVNVRVGNIEGWVSGDYLHRPGMGDQMHVRDGAVMVHPVGMAKAQTALCAMPGGEETMLLGENAYVHVLGERDGWLHVVVPRGTLTWQTDWSGTYGFVREKDMAVGVSKTDAMYKE